MWVDIKVQFGLNKMLVAGRVEEVINYCPGGSMSSCRSCSLNYLPHGLKSRASPEWGSVAKIHILGGAGKRWTTE